ncbi:MAG TPA: F0F1 ATP synthase subunit epsilon [Blastocatellia bacterium]|nr:F0F1 ATP synthase subunit epsilon [Blastocatellia bacterium]
MADKLTLEVVTPERLLFSEPVDEVVVPGLDGELGILPHHAAMVSRLSPAGVLKYRNGDRTGLLSIIGGFVEVANEKVSVLAEVSERPQDIDIERAKVARDRAQKRLSAADRDPDIDIKRAAIALERAMIRLQIAGQTSL